MRINTAALLAAVALIMRSLFDKSNEAPASPTTTRRKHVRSRTICAASAVRPLRMCNSLLPLPVSRCNPPAGPVAPAGKSIVMMSFPASVSIDNGTVEFNGAVKISIAPAAFGSRS